LHIQEVVGKSCVRLSVRGYISQFSSEDPGPSSGTLLADQIHLVLLAVVDLEFGQRGGGLGDQLALAEASGVREQFLLELLGDPLFYDDVVAVALERMLRLVMRPNTQSIKMKKLTSSQSHANR
jgi:hypothetical protein